MACASMTVPDLGGLRLQHRRRAPILPSACELGRGSSSYRSWPSGSASARRPDGRQSGTHWPRRELRSGRSGSRGRLYAPSSLVCVFQTRPAIHVPRVTAAPAIGGAGRVLNSAGDSGADILRHRDGREAAATSAKATNQHEARSGPQVEFASLHMFPLDPLMRFRLEKTTFRLCWALRCGMSSSQRLSRRYAMFVNRDRTGSCLQCVWNGVRSAAGGGIRGCRAARKRRCRVLGYDCTEHGAATVGELDSGLGPG